METIVDFNTLNRIEDFITLAGKKDGIVASVSLKELPVIQKVHPGQTEDMDQELNMYMLIGDFTFKINSAKKTVSKSYVYGSKESSEDFAVNVGVANARLKQDYKRMKEAGIEFEEAYFKKN